MEQIKTIEELLDFDIRLKYRNVRQFSQHTGIPYMTIKSVLQRGVENTSVGTFLKICDALKVPINYFFEQRAILVIDNKIQTKPDYSDSDLFEDLIENYIIADKFYTDEQRKKIVENYRFLASDWI